MSEKLSARTIERLAAITPKEYAELDRMITVALRRRAEGVHGQIKVGRTRDEQGNAVYAWLIGDEVKGIIARRPGGDIEAQAAFEAVSARYFADGVNAKSVVMHTPDGEERLR